jgi:2-succinyl-6-hydroxy-2,4-cyclohexadiene-1-carboxylate synthase
MGSAVDWTAVCDSLSDQYQCIAIDLPGHGGSTDLASELYTMEGAARSVIEVLDALEIKRTALAGYSMGGRLALYLALRHPERFTGSFLESASPGLENADEQQARREADERQARRLETGDFGEFLADWYRQPLFASLARDEQLLQRTIEARRRNAPGELAKSLRGMGAGSQPSLWGELSGLQVPALAVAGELDEKYAGLAQRMDAASPAVASAIVSDAGHNVRLEAPVRYMQTLRIFLKDTRVIKNYDSMIP